MATIIALRVWSVKGGRGARGQRIESGPADGAYLAFYGFCQVPWPKGKTMAVSSRSKVCAEKSRIAPVQRFHAPTFQIGTLERTIVATWHKPWPAFHTRWRFCTRVLQFLLPDGNSNWQEFGASL